MARGRLEPNAAHSLQTRFWSLWADSGHSLRVQTELDDLSIAAIPSAKKIKIPLHRRKAARSPKLRSIAEASTTAVEKTAIRRTREGIG